LALAAVGLLSAVAACRGSAPEKQEQAPSDSTPTAAAPLAVEWTDSDLENHLARIGYGSKPKEILARNADKALVFTPETTRDHVATAFMELAAYKGERSLELTVDAKAPGGEACLAVLQDQAFNILATVPCQTAGEQHALAKVPPTVTTVRVYFQSGKLVPIRLPAHMRLSEQR